MKNTKTIHGYQLGDANFETCKHQWRDHHDPVGEFKFCKKCQVCISKDDWIKLTE